MSAGCGCELRGKGYYSVRCADTYCQCHMPGGVNELTFETTEQSEVRS